MNDRQILGQIEEMVEEEKRLREQMNEGEAPQGARDRLHVIEEHLDQCWDLLRQRRGMRDRGQDPNDASPRDIDTVEKYQQ
jgi:hypothetical protein